MKNLFLNIDCMDPEKGLPSYPDGYFDLAIIDPPYGIKDDGRNHSGRVFKKSGKPIIKRDKRNGSLIKIKAHDYKLSSEYDNEQPQQSYFDELFRVSKHQIIWGCNYIQFDQKDTSSGRIIWDKVNGNTDQSDCEIAWTSLFKSVRQIRYMWNGMLQGKSIKEGHISQGNKKKCEKRRHPNHKPSILYKYIISEWGNIDWSVLDTHGGSGSSAKAYFELEMDFVWMEKDVDFFRDGVKWYKEYSALPRLKFTSQDQKITGIQKAMF